MKKLIYIFLIGAVIGGAIIGGLFLLTSQNNSQQNESQETVDFAISEWTADRDSSLIEARLFGHGLPGARVGFIPDTVKVLAKWCEETFHVPYSVTVAQWCLESRFGMSDLNASNFFGLSYAAAKPWMDDPDWVVAREQVVRNGQIVRGKPIKFAKFTNILEAFETHGRYLSGSRLYKDAFKQLNPEHFAREIAKHYATDGDYATKLIVIMRRYKLE
jgi:flagellum-specific peptidoglycan hydrolase FlgJ